MAQYYELRARALESAANNASGRGDHAEANRLWAEAARIGTRIEHDDEGFEIERPDLTG